MSENSVPLNPMVLLIIIPFLNGYFIGEYTQHFQTNPFFTSLSQLSQLSAWVFPSGSSIRLAYSARERTPSRFLGDDTNRTCHVFVQKWSIYIYICVLICFNGKYTFKKPKILILMIIMIVVLSVIAGSR